MQDRIFTALDKDGNEQTLRFKRPSQVTLSKAELVYRTAFSKAFRQEIITDAEVSKLLRDRGLWGEKEEAEVLKLKTKIIELEERLKDTGLSNEVGEEVCKEIEDLRTKVYMSNMVYQNIADNTCENIAREEQNKFLASDCVVDNKTGQRVYKDVDDFKSRIDEPMAATVFHETVIGALEIQTGLDLPTNLSDQYAENKWRSERKDKEDEETASVEEAAPKAKAKRKKKSS